MFYIRKILDDGLYEVKNTVSGKDDKNNRVAISKIKELGYDSEINVIGIDDIIKLESNGFKVFGYSKSGRIKAFATTSSVIRYHIAAMKIAGFKDMFIFDSVRGLILEDIDFSGSSIVFPPYITDIGDNCFRSSKTLESVTFKCKNVGVLSSTSFCDCPNLRSINFSGDIDTIALDTFSRTGLRNITLSCKEIGYRAFFNSQLEIVRLANCVHLGKSAFEKCTSLREVYLPKSLEVIEEFCFSGINSDCSIIVESYKVRNLLRSANFWGQVIIRED